MTEKAFDVACMMAVEYGALAGFTPDATREFVRQRIRNMPYIASAESGALGASRSGQEKARWVYQHCCMALLHEAGW